MRPSIRKQSCSMLMATTVATMLAVTVSAQATSADPSSVGAVTSYYTICPSTTSTTITLPGTTTVCQGGDCGSHYPAITAGPTPVTVIGDDGKETIYNIETTILPHLCEGGICGATYTISEECPCEAGPKTVTVESCPVGFTTTVVECTICAANGYPATVTITTPVSGGPYAGQTPAMGSAVYAPAAITNAAAAASTPASATYAAGAGAGPGTGNGSGPGSGSGSSSGHGSDSKASPGNGSGSGSGTNNGSGSGSGSNSGTGSGVAPAANAANAANVPNPAIEIAPVDHTGTASPSTGFKVNGTGPISPAISPFNGSASRSGRGMTMIMAGVIGCLAWML